MKRRTKLLISFGVVALLVGLIGRFVISPSLVVGGSMEPTLQPMDLCLMVHVHHYQPRRGDIVSFRTADDPPLRFIKRVIGLPGETVAITNGTVTIGGQPLTETYTTSNPELDVSAEVVPAGKVFVIGDNRDGSLYAMVATRLVETRLLWHWRWRK